MNIILLYPTRRKMRSFCLPFNRTSVSLLLSIQCMFNVSLTDADSICSIQWIFCCFLFLLIRFYVRSFSFLLFSFGSALFCLK